MSTKFAQEEYFDRDTFSSLNYAQHYNKQLKRNIIKETCILLADLEDRWPDFYGRLMSMDLLCRGTKKGQLQSDKGILY